jgi:hypothetical protein
LLRAEMLRLHDLCGDLTLWAHTWPSSVTSSVLHITASCSRYSNPETKLPMKVTVTRRLAISQKGLPGPIGHIKALLDRVKFFLQYFPPKGLRSTTATSSQGGTALSCLLYNCSIRGTGYNCECAATEEENVGWLWWISLEVVAT